MATATNKYTIAIIDEEQKERNKFLNFFEVDFNVVEISNLSDIDELIEMIRSEQIDAVAIDYRLKDHGSKFKNNGDSIFKELLEKLTDFPSFILTNNSHRAKKESKKINPLLIIDKSKMHPETEKQKKEFISDLKSVIKFYKEKIDSKLSRFQKLEALRKKNKLDEKNENEFLSLNYELSKSLVGGSPVTWKYFSQETNQKLSEVITKTDDLIKELKKKK